MDIDQSNTKRWQVSRIGARGDGIAVTADGPIYVPFSIPGDLVLESVPPSVVVPSQGRITPPCPHFADCGGCALQHVPPEMMANEKRQWLVDALARKGFDDVPIAPVQTVPTQSRRRARLAFVRTVRGVILGFNARGQSRIVDVASCVVLRPELDRLISPLRDLIAKLKSLGKSGDIQLTLSDTGVEVVFFPKRWSEPSLSDRETMVAFAGSFDLARIAWGGDDGSEPIAATRPVRVHFDEVPVEVPTAAFLQPSKEGEELIRGVILNGLPAEPNRLSIADLYAGCGSLGLPLAAIGHKVLAAEGDALGVQAMRRAAGALPLQAEQRDLARSPMSARELARFDVVVFDPPRAGAAKQSVQLAESRVPTVIAVSCNPATLARDLEVLCNGGYRLENAVPIDQFPWAAHLEAVCVLRRGNR